MLHFLEIRVLGINRKKIFLGIQTPTFIWVLLGYQARKSFLPEDFPENPSFLSENSVSCAEFRRT